MRACVRLNDGKRCRNMAAAMAATLLRRELEPWQRVGVVVPCVQGDADRRRLVLPPG